MLNWKRFQSDREFRARMKLRSEAVFGIRRFFRDRGFMEVETPVMVAHPDTEPTIDPFVTKVVRNDGTEFQAHLITSPEYSCKKLLTAGYRNLFEIARCFRNGEPWGGTHNPEFTMVEWYRAGADYRVLMEDLEQLVQGLAEDLLSTTAIMYQGKEIDLSAPWPRLSVLEAFAEYADINLEPLLNDDEAFKAAARDKGHEVSDSDTFDDIFFRVFLRDIESMLGLDKPVILYDYPVQMAALSRAKPEDPRLAERFEAYVCGLELCNAFSELTDAAEQQRRLEKDVATRAALGKECLSVDEQFLDAVDQMPESAGISLGVDRLVMLLTDAPTIRDVLFFPVGDLFNQTSEPERA
jgi:lysyl-tRNA synthetase class 2